MKPSAIRGLLVLGFATLACGAALAQATARRAWEPLGLGGGGGMYAPAISPADPNEMMVSSDMSGGYISADGGATWRMITGAQLHPSIRCRPAFHPTEPKTVFAAGQAADFYGLFVSRDLGITWRPVRSMQGDLQGAIGINPTRPAQMLVGVEGVIQHSEDGGATWMRCEGPTGRASGFCFERKTATIYAATEVGIWRSDDAGKTWARKTEGLPGGNLLAFAGGASADETILYCSLPGRASANGEYEGGVFVSRDRGETWKSAMAAGINKETKAFDEWAMGPQPQYQQLAVSDAAPRTVWALNTNTGIPPPHHASAYRSDDAGLTWRPTFQADPRFAGCNVETSYMVVADGQYYQKVPEPAIDAHNPNHLLLISDGDCNTTSDGGKTWRATHCKRAPDGPDGLPRWRNTGLVVTTTWNYTIDPTDPTRHFICYTDLGLAFSTDSGKTWAWWPENGRAPWGNTTYELAADPAVPGRIWGAFSNVHDIPNANIIYDRHGFNRPGGVCVSADHGIHWKVSNGGLPELPTTSIVLDPRSPKESRTLYAGQFGGGVYKSTDGGASWRALNDGLGTAENRRVCRVSLHRDGTLFALITGLRKGGKFVDEGAGVYRLRSGAATWEKLNRTQTLYWPKDFTVDSRDSRIVYVGACDGNGEQQGGLYRTNDGGATWQRLARKGKEHFGAYLSPTHPGWIYMTLTEDAPQEGLWLSRDNGATWSPMSGMPFENAQRVAFDPADPGAIIVTTFGGSVWRGPAEP